MARPNNLLAISTWTVEMSIILDPMASKKKRWRVSGKRNGRSPSSRFRRRWFLPCSRWFWFWFCVLMRGLLSFAIGFSRDWRWTCEFIDFRLTVSSIDLKVFRNFQKLWNLWSFKNLQKHVHWTVPVGSREVTYFLFLNDVQKLIPCNLLNNL